MSRLTDVVKNLIIINVIIYFGVATLPESFQSITELGNLYFYLSEKFRPFQIITSMFMHADIQHLLLNMLGLFFLGPMVERNLGPKKFFTLYIVAGLVGSIFQMGLQYVSYYNFTNSITAENLNLISTQGMQLLNESKNYTDIYLSEINIQHFRLINGGMLGASGCIYGVVLAFVTMFPREKLMIFPLPIPIKATYIGLAAIGISLFFGITDTEPGGIGHFAHLGGALVGFFMIHYWKMANLR